MYVGLGNPLCASQSGVECVLMYVGLSNPLCSLVPRPSLGRHFLYLPSLARADIKNGGRVTVWVRDYLLCAFQSGVECVLMYVGLGNLSIIVTIVICLQ